MGEPVFILVVNHLLDTVDSKAFNVPINKSTTAEDVCIHVCKQLNISPLTRHLFGLQTGKNTFAMPAATFNENSGPVDFRIRFKVANIMKLKKLGINAYNYYFHQARKDVWQNKIPEISYDKHKRELVGLGITDMYRVMLEKKISRDTVVSEYKKYIPKEVFKKHGIFVKSPIKAHLQLLEKSVHEASYVKAEYIRQLETIAPDYLSETYRAIIDQDGSVCTVYLKVVSSEIKYTTDSKKDQWEIICTIEDLGFISIRNEDGTLEISRKNGIPFYLKFNSSAIMYSFISLVDGYYRLSCKWTFNICSEVYTPSLQKLASMKCHGPVGGEFSYEKLGARANNKKGCFILRECESKFNDFYIDVCLKDDAKPTTFKLVKVLGEEFIFNDDLTKYKDIQQLMRAYREPNGAIYLQECLPPSEYDISPLLLCKNDNVVGDSLTDSSAVNASTSSPMCINSKNLLVYKGSWCYTTDPNVIVEACNVRDCDKPEECTIVINTIPIDRKVYILPQWKEPGLHGGLRFGVKEWNPDLLDGLSILITAQSGHSKINLQIGAEANEKIRLLYNDQIILEKTLPHVITAGKWSELWLQVRKGEIMLGFEGVPTTLFEWKSEKMEEEFEPIFMSFGSVSGHPLGLSFKCDECHTEFVGIHNYERYYPIGIWKEEKPLFNNLTLNMRGEGIILIRFMWLISNNRYYLLKLAANKATEKEGSRGITMTVRVQWKITRGKKVEAALKKLKPDYSDKYLKDFLTLAGQWVFLQSPAIVKLFGIAFTSNFSFVMEHFRLGPLDSYLRNNRSIIKEVDLIEAASNLASALWHLTENDFVHGNIRCRKLMVNSHDDNSFTVKLTDPGVSTEYSSSEVHWIPVECYSNLNFARKSTEADVWSFGTTLWEIFMYGEEIKTIDHVEAMRGYAKGRRLPKPTNCPNELYTLMRECWDIDPHKRKKPQAIMRDVNQILYQVYNSRRVHAYCKVFNKPGIQKNSGISTISINSNETESTILVESASGLIGPYDTSSEASETSSLAERQQDWMNSQELDSSYDWSNLISFNISTATTSLDSLNSTQSVFELDDDYTVVLQGRIGQGFYGEVYKATMERVGEDTEPKKVAVKKLKTNALSSGLQDFEREIHIMKTLHHPNIVEILGIFREECYLVMEFVPHGSLQSYLKIYKGVLQETQLLKYALDIAKGMDYLGEKNIVHRDLATRNILVVDENHVKISDFGLAQVIGSNDYYILRTPNRELPIKWYAPESLKEGRFSRRSDVWSYGVTLCEMFNYGEEPNLPEFGDIEGTQQQILLNALERGARFPCPANCQKSVYARIIYPCWNINPHGRPTFAKLVEEIEDMCSHLT